MPVGSTVLVETDGRAGARDDPVREAATRIAQVAGADPVLYDRSSESLFVDPYPSGSWTAEVDGTGGKVLPSLSSDVTDGRPTSRLARLRNTALRRHEAAGSHSG